MIAAMTTLAAAPGDVLAVWSSTSLTGDLIRVGEALRGMPTKAVTVQTPLEPAAGHRLAGDVVVVPVLRAGLGMLDAALDLVPSARVGYLGPTA